MTRNERLKGILDHVAEIIAVRGNERDLEDGERTMPRCVSAFNAITGNALSNEDGWMFMQLLKLCRSHRGRFKEDDYYDNLGYAALLAEEAFNTNAVSEVPHIPNDIDINEACPCEDQTCCVP